MAQRLFRFFHTYSDRWQCIKLRMTDFSTLLMHKLFQIMPDTVFAADIRVTVIGRCNSLCYRYIFIMFHDVFAHTNDWNLKK